jgi:acetyl-CoA synthetase
MLIPHGQTYDEIYGGFRWSIPRRYNIATDVCDRHAASRPDDIALIHETGDGTLRRYSFRQIQREANQLANTLLEYGAGLGDRVLIQLGQDPATAVGHVACWKAGIVSIPTSELFGADALEYRLRNSGAKIVITNRANFPKFVELRSRVAPLKAIFLVDGEGPGAISLLGAMQRASDSFTTLALDPETPAFISYTSGTTGPPKGTLHAHRVMLGHMPGVEFMFDLFPQPGDIMWSPADWAWLAGLFDILMGAWFHGRPVLSYRTAAFDAEQALHMMGKHGVRTALLTPTMLKMIRQVPEPLSRFGVSLRSVLTGTEAAGKDLLEWGNRALGVSINEGFGQTEYNMCLGNCSLVLPPRSGSLGRLVPSHVGAVIDSAGNILPPGEIGEIAFRRPHPVMMLRYWNNEQATADKFIGDWLLTGDLGRVDEEGYFWFCGRADDVITSAGYRIGPGEIEDALLRHPAVAMAAVIGVPDPIRTEAIKAFIVLAKGCESSDVLAESIRQTVRSRLAKHECPREIEFIDSMPMTTTGKLMRRALREAERARGESRSPVAT